MARKSRKNVIAAETTPKPQTKVWKAALYIRLSVAFNSNRGDSLETQQQIMEAYIALCPDIEIVGIYTDNGTTGRTFERTGFQRMLTDIEEGKIDCIVVKDLSRLGRNTIDTGYYIEKYFPLHHVRFIAVNDQYDSENAENSGNHLIVPLKNMINEAYAADISRKVKAQQRQAMKDGQYVGAQPPYGYRKDPKDCHHLLVNEETAPVVRNMFQWIADGVPLNLVVKRLNEQGILSPGRYLAQAGLINSQCRRANGMWQTWTVAKILTSEIYTGDMVQGKSKMVGHKQVPTTPDEWIVVRDTHEPLVSRELFKKVQIIREQAAKKSNAQTNKQPYTENILRGRIFCGRCGKPLNRHRDNKRGTYSFSCIANERVKKDACKGRVYIAESQLFHTIVTIICQSAENIVGKSTQLKQHDGQIAVQREMTEREISRLRQKTENNRKFLASLLESFNSGFLTRAEYLEMKEGYSQEIHAAAERVRQLQEQQKALENQRERYISLADRLAAVDKDTELSALLVDQLIERITVNGPNDVTIKFRFEDGFEQLMEVLADG